MLANARKYHSSPLIEIPAWKRYPFRAEPLRIGYYREYLPGFQRNMEDFRALSGAFIKVKLFNT